MCKKLSLLISVALGLSLAAPAVAIDFSDTSLLASYEPDEVNDLNTLSDPVKDSSLTTTWVPGGVNNVPLATEGDHVLKMKWTAETDRKIEVGHYWNDFNFDLAGADFIHADVYIATESAMPEIMGIWDNSWQYKWIDTDCEPIRTNEWRSISFGISALNEVGLDHIEALVFDKLAGTSGTIYVDNFRIGPAEGECQCKRKIRFSGYNWSALQSEWPMGVGPNYFTDDPNDVWIDPNGHLHLSIVYKDLNWYCSEVICNENLGYGTYVFTVKAREDLLDPNIVLGLFVYDVPDVYGNSREVDFELTRWGDPCEPNNGQYVVQPDKPGNKYRFYIDEHKTTTHVLSWEPDRICFWSYYGDFSSEPPKDDIIACWSYTGSDIPLPRAENPRINFWLRWGDPPSNGQNAKIVIKSFQYLPHSIVSPCCPLLVQAPNGGENWVVETTQNIQWETYCDANIPEVRIEYSTNNGQHWSDVNNAVPNTTGLYEWDSLPAKDSNQCLVRISDLYDQNIYDMSDDVFTIFQCRGWPITGDFNGDCYIDFKDFATFAATWLACGNPFDPACGVE